MLDHYVFIGEGSPVAAERFLDAAERTIKKLVRMPELGAAWPTTNPRLANIRVWRVSGFRRYLIFYRPIADGIEVLHVLHGSRDIEPLLEHDLASI